MMCSSDRKRALHSDKRSREGAGAGGSGRAGQGRLLWRCRNASGGKVKSEGKEEPGRPRESGGLISILKFG